MAHDKMGGGTGAPWDPDEQGDQQGNAPDGNEDGDDRGTSYPPPTNAATIPTDFVTFVNGLPTGFVQAFEAATVGGTPWSPMVLTGTSGYPITVCYPTALFANISTPQPQPLILSGDQVVGLISDGSAPLTVVDTATPYQYIATGTGGMTLFLGSESGSVVAEGGTNVFVAAAGTSNAWTFDLQGGTNLVFATGGNDTVQTAAGSTNTVVFGSGNDAAFSAGNDLFFGGSGNDTITAGGSNATVVGGSGSMTFIDANTVPGAPADLVFGGSGQLNVQGGSGSVIVVVGSGGGNVIGGAGGNNLLFGGNGPTTLVGGGSGDILVAGAAGGNDLLAGNGNETLIASASGNNILGGGGSGTDVMVLSGGNNTVNGGSGGTDAIWSGSGNTVVNGNGANLMMFSGLGGNATVQAGTGTDQFTFVNGQAGGLFVINGFDATNDTLNLVGYASGSESVTSGGGSTTVLLSDNTQIQLVGLASLPSSAIV